MNLLLIHREVRDAQVFVDSVNSNTRAVLYNETLPELTGPIEQLGVVFVKGMTFMGKPFEEQADLLNAMIAQHQIKRIDFLACNTLPEWSEFYAKLNTVVGASSDRTGNLKYGGNWVMESTGQDIEAVYFTQSIEYYKYLLDVYGVETTFVMKTDTKLWARGSNIAGQVMDNNRYIKKLTAIPGAIVDASFQMTLGQTQNSFLVGGALYGLGSFNNTFSTTPIPTGVGTLTKVVSSKGDYCACILLGGKTYFKGRLLGQTFGSFTVKEVLDPSGNPLVVTNLWGEYGHFIALADGNLYGIGSGGQGQIGASSDTTTWAKIDYPVGETGPLTQVFVGLLQTYIVMGGTLYGIGRSYWGELGSPPYENVTRVFKAIKYDGTNNATQVTCLAGGGYGVFFVNNNKLYKSRRENTFLEVAVPGIVTSVSVGELHMVMTIGGNLYGMGTNDDYQLGDNVRNIVYNVNRGGFFSQEVTVPYQITVPGVANSVTQAVAANYHTMIVSNGILYGMGNNLGDGNNSDIVANIPGLVGIPRVMYLDTLTEVRKSDGTELLGVTKYGYGDNILLVAAQGKVYGQGKSRYAAFGVQGINSQFAQDTPFVELTLPVDSSGAIQHLATNGQFSIVVKGGQVYGSGNWYPTSNLTSFTKWNLPAGVTSPIEQVSVGGNFFSFLIGGKLYGLGNNDNYRMGGDSTAGYTTIKSYDSTSFTISNATMIAAGDNYTLFVMKEPVTNNDLLYGVGAGYSGFQRITFPSGIEATTPIDSISVGYDYMCVIFNKKLYGKGYNHYRQISNVGSNDLGWTLMAYQGQDITTATKVMCAGRSTRMIMGGKMYARGQNVLSSITPAGDSLDWVLISEDVAGGSLSIESVSRMNGTTNTQITLTGTLFGTVTSVVLDTDATTTVSANAVTCAIVAGRTATSLTFKIPAGNGTKRIKLVTADKNYVVTGDFAYRNPIQITSLSSYTGTKNKIINIVATDMTNLARIKFNGVATTAFSRISNTEYTVVVPDSTSGTVVLEDIFNVASVPPISFSYQTATLVNGFISPATSNTEATISGKAGDTLTLVGTFLSDTNAVYFGNTPATLVRKTGDNIVVTVPVELGTVSIRIYDENNNMTVCSKQFVYQLAAVVQGAVQAVVQASTIDASGQKYYSILEGTSYFIVKYVSDTSYNKLYSNALQPIRGIACSGTTLYFCDPSNNRIQSIPSTTTTMLTVATPVLTRVTMVPEAIKVKGTKLWIVCTNTGVSTNDAIVILDGTTTAQTYAAFGAYSLQGIAYNPSVSDTSLYISAVSYSSPNKILTAGTGRIFKTDAVGANPIAFIQGLTNPIDLTFSNGYLVVDGIINIYSPSGLLVSTLNTPANSIITEVRLGQESVSFTTAGESGTTVNELTMPPYIPDVLQLTASYSPNKGPKGTLVTIVGYNMTQAGITSIKIRDASSSLIDPISSTVTSNVIVLRMPDKPASGTEVTIVVTPVTGSPQEYAFSYQSPDLVNIIPLFSGETKYFHFTGSNLQNIQYVEFVDTSTNELSVNKLPVRNVTARSFNCSFVTVPINTTRCLLLDAFGAVTIEDANYFSLSSETCFLGGTPVLTDQGEVPIDKLDCSYHTIDQQEIVAVTKTRYNKDTLILLEKDSLKKNYPTRDTVITHKHKIYYKGKMKRAESFVKKEGVHLVPYKNQYLYNVLLKTHEVMRINGLICETLYPKNPIAKFFTPEA